ncbi:MAG: aromatic ring-hydroxylating dioxygenase subunit alpha [Gemmatimonadales bacterium]|jgi:choline monooxygenase|nr:aromatic ring-hydroxylating dioxygenase subunit alpha [Gemmatimonadales bacterium]MBT7126157.1 aromatic ring-hydroxylating dioxygenase subunit alpha [Gemmatimonadales bacterium]MBT7430968.1 aromatic ring-hydroxylating dioxygenase subunit alpha [Ilumatobacter sp.]
MSSDSARLTVAEVEAILAPIDSASTLPRRAFTSEAFFDWERQRITERNWLAACFSAEVSGRGDAIPVDLWGVPIVVLRDDSGGVRAFHNVCAYDGCPVLTEPVRDAEDLVATYHGWRYALNGDLIEAPFFAGRPGNGRDAVPSQHRHLAEIPVAEAVGIVFVDLFPDVAKPTFDQHVAPLLSLLAEVDLDGLKAAVGEDLNVDVFESVIATNWKTVVENDCINILHESFTHELYNRSLVVPRVAADGTPLFQAEIDGDLIGFSYAAKDAAGTYPEIDIPHIGNDGRPKRGFFVQFHPNVSLAMTSTVVAPILQFPEASDRTRVRGATLVRSQAAGPEYADRRSVVDDLFVAAAAEDRAVIEAVQQTRSSPTRDGGFYSPFWDQPHHALSIRIVHDLIDQEVR